METASGYMEGTSPSGSSPIPMVARTGSQDLIKVSRFIRLQITPIIVVEKLLMAPRSVIMEQERELRNFIESWRQAWESKDLDRYMAHYSPNFQSCWLDFNGWKEKKRRLNKRYDSIRVKLGNVYLYRQDGLITTIFTQSYGSKGFHSSGIKVLYIYAWRQIQHLCRRLPPAS